MMETSKQRRLQKGGWKLGSAEEFLGLSDVEARLVQARLGLSAAVRRYRLANRLTQTQLAKALGSSQSRVAKLEAGDASVSLDLLIRALFTLRAPAREIAATLG